MSVYIKDKAWAGRIPFVADGEFAKTHVKHFNGKVGKTLFVERTSETDYVEFKLSTGHAQCEVGKKGGKQVLNYTSDQYSILHEMCHCTGLGHEQYHPKWKFKEALEKSGSLHWDGYLAVIDKYTAYSSTCDEQSIMLYNPGKLGLKPADVGLKEFAATSTDLSKGDIEVITYLYKDVS